ncbi:hypothetical protein N7532_006584 [Penicillium argentinense]|uniref:Arrestin-like N-terminal domain-containing protein n=1 Tax=Penicillium argentinense TaxID=1131581 RepID=A0A9W9KB22_9EURO|nr:uncharacterized protein N7532_006584 [Penicillium argentinense]KAJ5099583.1 hypothetical protein N7532_006584 [Penicillium argentinense]
MPPAEDKGSDDFKFSLWAPPRGGYAACDTIVGSLIRKTPVVAPEAVITLSLTGRAKTRFTKTKAVYRNSRQLVSTGETVIFKGPIHLAADSKEPLRWPFAVGIPLEPATSCKNDHSSEASLLPVDQDHPGHHLLPGTFVSMDPSFAEPARCYVEYYLTARLHFRSSRRSESHESIRRIILRHPLEPLLKSPSLKVFETRRMIQSHRLMPEKGNAGLSFRQKMQTFFESSKVPQFHYNIILTVPEIIQLDNPEPFPLLLQIRPQIDRTSERIQDVMPDILAADVRMILKENTAVIAADIWDKIRSRSYWEPVELGLSHAFRQLESPIIIPTATESKPVNLGKLFGLVLHQNGLSSHKRVLPSKAGIHPDFMTYNIRRTHEVGWQVTLLVAGQLQEAKFSSAVTILSGPSSGQST